MTREAQNVLPYTASTTVGYLNDKNNLTAANLGAVNAVIVRTTHDELNEKVKHAERAYLKLQLKYYGAYVLLFGGSLTLSALTVYLSILAVLNKTADPLYIGANRSGEDSEDQTHFNTKANCDSILSGYFNPAFATAMKLSGEYSNLIKAVFVYACGGSQTITVENSTFTPPEHGVCADYE